MANLASTIYDINGTEEQIKEISEAFKGTETIEDALKVIDPEFDDTEFLGEILDSGLTSPTSFSITTSTNWQRCLDLEEVLLSRFEDLTIYYLEEEFGCNIYRTNDSSGEIFPDKYYADIDCEGEYFTDDQSMLDWINGYLGTDFKSVEDARKRYDGEEALTILECERI